jgi:DNA primase
VITKSLKDVMTLDALNIPAISAVNEGTLINQDIITDLKKRFKSIICIMDDDNAGRKIADKYLKLYNIPSIYVPQGKDISGMYKILGKDAVKQYLKKNLINNE